MMFKRSLQLLFIAALLLPASAALAKGKTAQASKAKRPSGVIHLKRMVFHVPPQKPLVSVDMQRRQMNLNRRVHKSFVHRISSNSISAGSL